MERLGRKLIVDGNKIRQIRECLIKLVSSVEHDFYYRGNPEFLRKELYALCNCIIDVALTSEREMEELKRNNEILRRELLALENREIYHNILINKDRGYDI